MVETAIDAAEKAVETGGGLPERPAAAEPEKHRVLPALRDVTLVGTIYLFFAGFVFRYFYLRLLGLSPNDFDLPLNTLLVLAFNVFLNFIWLPIVMVAALGVLAVPKVRAVVDAAFVPLVACLAIGGFYVLYLGARSTAVTVAAIVRDGGLPQATLALRAGTVYDRDFQAAVSGAASNALKAYVVEQNASTYFVLVRHTKSDPLRPDRMYAVPKSDVLFHSAALGLPAR